MSWFKVSILLVSSAMIIFCQSSDIITSDQGAGVTNNSESHESSYGILPSYTDGQNEDADENCEKICDQVDEEGTRWIECEGKRYRNCSGGATGIMSWTCLLSGQFETPQPYFKYCTTRWISVLHETLNKEEAIPFRRAIQHLKTIKARATLGHNPMNLDDKYYGHEMEQVLELILIIMNLVNEKNLLECEELTDLAIEIYDSVYKNNNLWTQLTRKECTKLGTDFLGQTEQRLLRLSTAVFNEYASPDGDYTRNYTQSQFKPTIGVKRRKPGDDSENHRFVFPFDANTQKDSYIELPPDWMHYADEDNDNIISFVGLEIDPLNANYLFPADYNVYGENATNDYWSAQIKEDKIVNGNILSFSFGESEGQHAHVNFNGTGVRIVIKHNVSAWGDDIQYVRRKLHPGEPRKAVRGSAKCSFWVPENLTWSTEGCVVVQVEKDETICECYHLTAFALLMDLHDYVGRDIGLQILTWILTPLSILCLILTVLILSFLRSIRNSPRSIITKHLSVCLAIAMILMLTLMDKHHILTDDTICSVTGVAIHYFLLCAFLWMLFEGILLYRMVVLVFENGREYMKYQIFAAYGIPLIIVGATLIISRARGHIGDAYGGDAGCWLEGNYIWAFLGPISVILAINFVVLVISLKTAHDLAHNKLSHKKAQKKGPQFLILLRGSFSIASLLGVTWIFGYFMFINNVAVSNAAAYIFTVLNASQGIFLFVFHCLLNAKVREALGSHSTSGSTSNLQTSSSSDP